ncbi:carbamoyltransferase N-terminal domain-containing protein [Streptomyces sp. NBC_00203]|uniref:carbamoyltransferase N-terminal domain-containing protein n=1 Tax=Streptomyces sp. NBC_00203 TaxID=2975680 RepID=UPI00324C273B
MIICGVKITHDGGVALIDNGRLVFSIEMEKIGNNPRHQRVDDLDVVTSLLGQYGYTLGQVDRFVLDGWRKTPRTRMWGGQEVSIDLGPYRRGILDDDLLRPYHFRLMDLEYTSYAHYAGHMASAYCSSPFAASREASYVLCWDGAMFPFLYYYDPVTGKAENLGPLFHLLGDTYHSLSRLFPPFEQGFESTQTASGTLPGKIMAYVAHGSPVEKVVDTLEELYQAAEYAVLGPGPLTDDQIGEGVGRRILELMCDGLPRELAAPDDMLASIHAFLGQKLVARLTGRIRQDGSRSANLCLVGGCALNIKWNRDIRASEVVQEVWIPPFPNDAGSALGAACCELLRSGEGQALDWSVFAGPALVDSGIPVGWEAQPCSPAELAEYLHRLGDPVLVLHGRAELGPRALGHRSILAPAVAADMKGRLNQLKGREGYRPVAPICLEASAEQVFEPGTPDPYMLFDHDVRPQWRDRVPAVCHLDGTARLQTVNSTDDPVVFEILTEYHRISSIPLLCNTSANLSGRGFFPDLRSAMEWGRIPAVWSEGVMYRRASGSQTAPRSNNPRSEDR